MSQVSIPNVKIAVIDGDLLVRDFVSTVLMYCVNRDVLSFDNGMAAWRYLEGADSPDIIISEVNVSGLNGFELLARDSGADAFLAKPVSVTDLFRVVEAFVV